MSDRIDVVLKVKDRPYDQMKYLEFWLDTFKNEEKYRVLIWDDTSDRKVKSLIGDFRAEIVTKKDLSNWNEIQHMVDFSEIALGWRKAAYAHIAAFYIAQTQYFWNIDADDMKFKKPLSEARLYEIEQYAQNANIFATSWDIYWSKNLAFPSHPHHWSFGVAFLKRDIDYLSEIMKLSGDLPPWAVNIDVLFEYVKPFRSVQSFVFDNELMHEGQCSKYKNGKIYVRDRPDKPWVQTSVFKDVVVFKERNNMKPIKNLVFDCDGTLTDGKYYYTKDGKIASAFHANDSVAVKYAKDAGMRVIVISSGSYQDINKRRAEDIGIEHIEVPFGGKLKKLMEILDLDETAYIGDCFDDVEVFREVELSFAPSDALVEVKREADISLVRGGGQGCILEAWLRVKEFNERIANSETKK